MRRPLGTFEVEKKHPSRGECIFPGYARRGHNSVPAWSSNEYTRVNSSPRRVSISISMDVPAVYPAVSWGRTPSTEIQYGKSQVWVSSSWAASCSIGAVSNCASRGHNCWCPCNFVKYGSNSCSFLPLRNCQGGAHSWIAEKGVIYHLWESILANQST